MSVPVVQDRKLSLRPYEGQGRRSGERFPSQSSLATHQVACDLDPGERVFPRERKSAHWRVGELPELRFAAQAEEEI